MNTSEKAVQQRSDMLQKYVSDMIAVEEHIGSAVKRQMEHEDVYKHNPQASQIIQTVAKLTEQHAEHLKQHLETLGGDPAKGLKEVATAALGTIAGLYDKVRTETVSKMLRDDFTALSLATMGYTMLHTTGLALQDQPTAAVALRHLKEYTPLVMQFDQLVPSVIVAELRADQLPVNESSIQESMKNTQEAWKPPTDGGSYQNSKSSGSSNSNS